jgi:alkylhydroperoxidase family enzyme
MINEQPADEFTIHPVSSEAARLRVTETNGSVDVLVRHAAAAAGVRLTANEARVLANVRNATAQRVEAEQ